MRKFFIGLLTMCCLCAAAPASAQARLGFRGGLDVSEMSFSGDVFKNSNRMGFFIGPVLKFPLFGLGFDISALYAKRNGELKGATKEQYQGKYSFSDKQVLVPIHVRYGIDFNDGNLFAYAGPQFAFSLDDEEQNLKDQVLSWRSRDSNLSFDIGGGVAIGHIELTVNYNVPLGKAGEVHLKDAADEVIKGSYKTWKISAAYYF